MQILLQNGLKIVKKSSGAAPRTRQTPARYGVCPRGAAVREYGKRTVGSSSAGCAELLERNEFVFVAAAVAGAVCGREADASCSVVAADDGHCPACSSKLVAWVGWPQVAWNYERVSHSAVGVAVSGRRVAAGGGGVGMGVVMRRRCVGRALAVVASVGVVAVASVFSWRVNGLAGCRSASA